MKAQAARFAIWACSAVLAAFAWLRVDGWTSSIAFVVILAIGCTVAEWIFRKLATPDEIRADLEDRVRNPPL
jgi:hypothetical protein